MSVIEMALASLAAILLLFAILILKRLWKLLRLLVVLGVVLIVGSIALLPSLVASDEFREHLTTELSESLPREVTVESIHFSYTSGLTMEGIALEPREGYEDAAPFAVKTFTFEAKTVDLLGGLFRGAVPVNAVRVDGLQLDLRVRPEGNNYSDLIEWFQAQSNPDREPSVIDLDITTIELTHLNIIYSDEAQGLHKATLTGEVTGQVTDGLVTLTGELRLNDAPVQMTAELNLMNGKEAFSFSAKTDATGFPLNESVRPVPRAANEWIDAFLPFASSGFLKLVSFQLSGRITFDFQFSGDGYSRDALAETLVGSGSYGCSSGNLQPHSLLRGGNVATQTAMDILHFSKRVITPLNDSFKNLDIAFTDYHQEFRVERGEVHLRRGPKAFLRSSGVAIGLSGVGRLDGTLDYRLHLDLPPDKFPKWLRKIISVETLSKLFKEGAITYKGSFARPQMSLDSQRITEALGIGTPLDQGKKILDALLNSGNNNGTHP